MMSNKDEKSVYQLRSNSTIPKLTTNGDHETKSNQTKEMNSKSFYKFPKRSKLNESEYLSDDSEVSFYSSNHQESFATENENKKEESKIDISGDTIVYKKITVVENQNKKEAGKTKKYVGFDEYGHERPKRCLFHSSAEELFCNNNDNCIRDHLDIYLDKLTRLTDSDVEQLKSKQANSDEFEDEIEDDSLSIADNDRYAGGIVKYNSDWGYFATTKQLNV